VSSFDHVGSQHRPETTENYSEIRNEAQRFIEENVAGSATLNDFTMAKGYSSRHVQRALSWFDTNWRRMLLDERMKRARELLRASGEPVNRVAEMVGYEHSQFSRTFKAEEGKSPEEYREWIRQQ
jgi:AraC-like DNA-binding protein